MVSKDIEIARSIADCYGIYIEPITILNLAEYISKIRAESAEQARKEAADRFDKLCMHARVIMSIDARLLIRDTILAPLQNVGNSEQVPTERNKLEIAVKTLEYLANYSGCEASGLDMRDMAEKTLKDIQ